MSKKARKNQLTPAIAKGLSVEHLIELYENAVKVFKGAPKEMPSTRMRAEKRVSVARAELLRRGFSKDEVDYIP